MISPDVIRTLKSVENTRNLFPIHLTQPIELVFWICPNISKNGWRFNKASGSLSAHFIDGLSEGSLRNIERAQVLKEELSSLGVPIKSITALYATADAILLVETPLEYPDVPKELTQWMGVISTATEVDGKYLMEWGKWRRKLPWKNVPGRFYTLEINRLRGIPWNDTPEWAMNNWLNRILAGYAQDGIWLRRKFHNPVIAGVESPGVPVLQNAALQKHYWIPVIQLK